MFRHRTTCSLILTVLLVAGVIQADDRVLLRATGAPANVLLILDSGALMTFDGKSNSLNFIAGGDDDGRYTEYMKHVYGTSYLETTLGSDYETVLDRGSKLTQAKRALRTFFNIGFEFNFGFSYYNKKEIEQHYHNYIYRVKERIDTDGDGVADAEQAAMLDGTPPGAPLRFGHWENFWGNRSFDPTPAYPVRYGKDGTSTYTLWEHAAPVVEPIYGSNRTVFYDNWGDVAPTSAYPYDGARRIVSQLVTSNNAFFAQPWSALTALQRMAGSYHYYPAYDWNEVSLTVQKGLNGIQTWTNIANGLGFDTSELNGPWKVALRDYVLTDIQTKADGVTSNQIGNRTIYVREQMQVFDRVTNTWVNAGSKITEMEYVQHFALMDHDPAEDVPRDTTLSSFSQQGSADCTGFMEQDPAVGKTPLVGISQPDPATGDTKDLRWLIDTTLGPQTAPVFYFPNHADKYVPTNRDDYIPGTETVIAYGRRPIKDTISMADQYYGQTVTDWDDPLANCRMNFLILITDGKETCSNDSATCALAASFDFPVYVIYLGSEDDVQDPDLTSVECIADESGGLYFSAGNEQEMVAALLKIAMDIEERTRGFASPIVPSVNSSTDQTAYISTFTPKDGRSVWRGHLRAYPIDPYTGVIANLRPDGTPNPLAANWDAGDTLAVRTAASRRVYYGVPDPSAKQPGIRKDFVFPSSDSASDIADRTLLGTQIFYPDPWLDTNGDEVEANKDRLEGVVNFVRGAELEVSPSDPDVVTVYGRDPNLYGWCSATGDQNDGDPEPCALPGAVRIGIEKLGDIFHSTPQLMARPECFECWFQNLWGYRDDTSTLETDDGFVYDQRHRRQVLFTGADDGSLHAFEGGIWDVDGATIDGVEVGPMYDKGTGRELFAWVPQGVMDTLDSISYGAAHEWTVDGTPTVADVYVDPQFTTVPSAADREWRSVVLFGERRGGHTYVALDVTSPTDAVSGDLTIDPWSEATNADRDPANTSAWPTFKWEFFDRLSSGAYRDEDMPPAPGLTQGNGVPDLGQTWSRPLVGFLKVDPDNNPDTPAETKNVMIVGGGFHPQGLKHPFGKETGNYIFGIDIETGDILFKRQVVGMIPSQIVATDIDFDGYLETLYWGTTSGYLYKMDVTVAGTYGSVTVNGTTETRITNWVAEPIFTAPAGQPFFMRPALSPIAFNPDGTPVIALAIGTGNRDDIMETNVIPHRFYVVVDRPNDSGPIVESDLAMFNLDTTQVDNTSLLGGFGWALELWSPTASVGEDWEKVNTAALILEGYVIFSTFNPSSEVEEVPIWEDDNGDGVMQDSEIRGYACRRGGNARTYVVNLYNSNPQDPNSRFIQHPTETAMATEPVIYLGADGRIHVIQALDNLRLQEPVAAIKPVAYPEGWKEE